MAFDMVDAITDLKDPSTGKYLQRGSIYESLTDVIVCRLRQTLEDTRGGAFRGGRRRHCRAEDAAVLPVRRQRQYRLEDGIDQRGDANTYFSINERTHLFVVSSF